MSKPLSKTQQELLDAMRAGVKVHYMRYMGRFNPTPYYFRVDNYQRVTAAAKGLIERGIAVHAGAYKERYLRLKDDE